MPKPPRRPSPQTKKSNDVAVERIAGRALVGKMIDPRQSGLFDRPLPKWIKPCLPTLVDRPPVGDDWIHEIKWDGYRVSAYVADGKVTIRTRNGHDWTSRFPNIAAALLKLNVRSAVIDGEAVVLDDMGRSNFSELQADLTRHGSEAAVMYAFDLLFLDGEDLRTKPLGDRREALGFLMRPSSAVMLSDEYTGSGADLFRVACEHELEGIVSKRIDAPYRSGRSKTWLKTKSILTEAFVVVGYQPTSGAVRGALANLKLARLDGGRLVSVGNVGTGFSDRVATMLRAKLDAIVMPKCAVPGLKTKGAVWVRPDLQAEIAYRGTTAAGELRHASFKGLVD
ncbi:non-homologous end-joining DNA ligase [Beijerinckia sp. L45]|uniref:non-homologous end-joining DNA ligase n=1 Tax=Beijerinckia sp. L45 TaxID=1641855 RepID=UPI00131A9F19|nr:non-homologous end-joining DNA ligase [Beijerinckia sp. L45]